MLNPSRLLLHGRGEEPGQINLVGPHRPRD